MNGMFHRGILLILRVVIGGIFIYAGISKIQDSQAFADSIATFELLSPALIDLFALGLPVLEIMLGLLLIIGWWRRSAILGILLLATLFTIALAQGLARGLHIDCGCFGGGAPSAVKTSISLGRDVLLILVAAWMYRPFIRDAKAGR